MPIDGTQGQTYAVRFDVLRGLDGITQSPPVSLATRPSNPQQFYEPVDAPEFLGLIDPNIGSAEDPENRRGAIGNRWISFLWIRFEPGAVAAPGASIDVVDALDGASVVQQVVARITASIFVRGIFVPQGSMIRVNGVDGPVIVEVHIAALVSVTQDAVAKIAQVLGES